MTASNMLQVREAILLRIKAMPFFAAFPFSYTKHRALQIQPNNLPMCGVYFLQETRSPEGDANAGEPRFRVQVRYGISVIVLNNDMDAAEVTLDLAASAIRDGLYSDSTLYNNASFEIQGYTYESRRHNFGVTVDQETPFAELQLEMVCDLGTEFYPPIVLDDLDVIHVKTVFPLGGTQEEIDAVQQVSAEYDLPQN